MKKTINLLLVLVLVLGLLGGCSPKTEVGSQGEGDTIKVGLNYELSGNVATYGQSLTAGIELAMEEINNNGGVLGKQIEIIKGVHCFAISFIAKPIIAVIRVPINKAIIIF